MERDANQKGIFKHLKEEEICANPGMHCIERDWGLGSLDSKGKPLKLQPHLRIVLKTLLPRFPIHMGFPRDTR